MQPADNLALFQRRWGWLTHRFQVDLELAEADRLQKARGAWVKEHEEADAAFLAAVECADPNLEKLAAARLEAQRSVPQLTQSFSARLLCDRPLDSKEREAVRDCLGCYRRAAAGKSFVAEMNEFLLWFGHRVASDPDWRLALSDLTTGGTKNKRAARPLQEQEIVADVAVRRSFGVSTRDPETGKPGKPVFTREAAIAAARKDWPGAGVENAVKRADETRLSREADIARHDQPYGTD